MMKRRYFIVAFLLLFTLPLYPFGVESSTPQSMLSTTIRGADVFQQGALLPIDELEVHVRPGVVSSDVALTLVHESQPNTAAQRSLTKRYRMVNGTYTLAWNGEATDQLVVRMLLPTQRKKRQRLFYRSDSSSVWTRLETQVRKNDGYLQATLPSSSGQVALGVHRFALEQPIRESDFSSYVGTAFSDTAAVIDVASGRFLYRQEASKVRSIASLSKLVTTHVFLSQSPNLDDEVTYRSSYDRIGATVPLEDGERVRLRDALYATLIPSANNMATVLGAYASTADEPFTLVADQALQALGLGATHLDEPSGLDADNVSTAGNIARLARTVFTRYSNEFLYAAQTRSYSLVTTNTNRSTTLYSTNQFDGKGMYDVRAFKTGYLPGTADRTLAIQLQERSTGNEIIIVLLGNPQYNTIFSEAYDLAQWTFTNWSFPQ